MIRTNKDLLEYITKMEKYSLYPIGQEIFEANQQILKQDGRNNKVFIIQEGLVKCYLSDRNGKEFIQEFLGPGMEFGELEVFSKKTNICSVSSISELRVFVLSHRLFEDLLKKETRFNSLIMSAFADKVGYKAPRHSYQQSYSITKNVLRLKQVFPQIFQVLKKKDIADYLGITIRSLNRALKRFEQDAI